MPYFNFDSPTDFKPVDRDPSVPPEDKLLIIDTSRPLIEIGQFGNFCVSLPFADGALFNHPSPSFPTTLSTEHVNVGDPALFRKGIGSRILKAAAVFGKQRFPEVDTVAGISWTRLGFVNAAISVFGAENTTVETMGKSYGERGDKDLGQLFTDYPPMDGETYFVSGGVTCTLDEERMAAWSDDQPIVRYELPKERPPYHQNGMNVDVETISDKQGNSLLAFYYRGVGEFVIANIEVAPERRRKGAGTALIGEAIKLAKNVGARRLIGEADSPEALAFARAVLPDPAVREIPLHRDAPEQVRAMVEVAI